MTYDEFLQAKTCAAQSFGLPCELSEINPILKPHQRDIVKWAVEGGRRAIFAAFGLGKSVMQLEIVRIILSKTGGRGLIVTPLGVRQEFKRDAAMLGIDTSFIRLNDEYDQWEISGKPHNFLTNYESIRDSKLDPKRFTVVSLDEAAVLRGFGGSKTFREMMGHFEGSGIYRFVATATPSPNEFIELLAYAAFLDIMDVGGAKTRFFKRNSVKADELTINPEKEKEFWLWMASWAIFIQAPSNLGYSDEGYTMPEMDVRWHEVPFESAPAMPDKRGQKFLFNDKAFGLSQAAHEKQDSLKARIGKMMELREEDLDAHRIIWHDLEVERLAIERAIPTVMSVYGSQDWEEREDTVIRFAQGDIHELAGKPSVCGVGCNFQRHCNWAIFLGIGWKFAEFIQAIHRIQRFLQTKVVRIDIIYTEAERSIRADLEEKWDNHKKLVKNMTEIIEKHGLSTSAIHSAMNRKLGCERVEVEGVGWKYVNNDCVNETATMKENSVGLIVTSIPFSNQYEYSPSYNDFGHTDDVEHFFRQMDYLTPNLLKVLQPGRIFACHVKDRIMPGGLTGLGFQTLYPFHADCIAHYKKHGFAFLGMKTIITDVVRENNQTYRLGYSEQCLDGSRMGCGVPEQLLIFRKPQTDRTVGRADVPVEKSKDEYSLGKWQFDAHALMRISGDRQLTFEELRNMSHADIFKWFKKRSLTSVYNFEADVAFADELRRIGMLPTKFMLLQPQSWHPDVWTDVVRMRTLNLNQHNQGKEHHLCPMQFDVADRCIEQYSMVGEVVYDPFGGLGTVPMRAIMKGRFGLGTELSPEYFADACCHIRSAELKKSTPSLFELIEDDEAEAINLEAAAEKNAEKKPRAKKVK